MHCSGRAASDCPVHLDIFAADVALPGGVCLEAVTKQRGQGRVAIGLLDASHASMPLTGAMPHRMSYIAVIAAKLVSYNTVAPASGGSRLTLA